MGYELRQRPSHMGSVMSRLLIDCLGLKTQDFCQARVHFAEHCLRLRHGGVSVSTMHKGVARYNDRGLVVDSAALWECGSAGNPVLSQSPQIGS